MQSWKVLYNTELLYVYSFAFFMFGNKTPGVCPLKLTVHSDRQKKSIYQVDFVSFLGLVMSLVPK